MCNEQENLEIKVEEMLMNKQFLTAYELVKRKIEADGTNPLLLALMGKITYSLEEYKKSYQFYKQAVYYDKNNREAMAGILLLSSKIPVNEPLELYFVNIEELESKTAFLAKMDYFLKQNNIKAAVKAMKKAYEKYSNDITIILAYINVLIKNNINDTQIKDLIADAKKQYNGVEILQTEIIYLYKTGNFDQCEKMSKRMMQRYPNSDISQTALELLHKIKLKRIADEEKKKKQNEVERNKPSGAKEIDSETKIQKSEMSGDEAEQRLDALIGLESVKKEIYKIKKRIEFDKARKERLGIEYVDEDSYHFVFSGNPGTGKTTVARLLADILHGVGLLKKGQLVEVERGDLVGEFQGHTAKKTKKVIQDALGGVLFIDEAYGLVNGKTDDFGHEAVDALVKGIEDHRNELVVILAGYKEEMRELISANVGLESRFTRFIEFPDYTEQELVQIAQAMAKEQHYTFSKDGELAFKEKINKKKVNKKFGNARAVRAIMNEAYTEKAVNFDENETSLDYMTILTPDDFGVDMSKNSAHKAKAALEKLEKLTGLKDVKYEIKSTVKIVDYLKQEREDGNSDSISVTNNLHMCFAGNPGTGKTTVARIYAEVLAALGISKTGELIEVCREDLVGRYVGETAIKTKEVCEKSYGGVLFIDEAYDLVHSENDSFGREAVATLIKQMEDNRDKMIVIFAGYSKEMKQFMESNSGIKSRISKTIVFPDYSEDELYKIFNQLVLDNNILIGSDVEKKIHEVIHQLYVTRDSKFGNAREMRNLYENTWKNMVDRVETNHLTGEERKMFKPEDLECITV